MTMTLRISDEDSRLIKDFAKLHGISASEFMRRAALEKIEDDLADPVTYSHEEMGRLLGLSEDADA